MSTRLPWKNIGTTPCVFQQLVEEIVSVLQSVYYGMSRLPPVFFTNLCRKLSLCFNLSTMSSPTPCGFQQPVQETVSVLQSVYYVLAYPLWFSTTCAGNCLCASICLLCPRLPPVVFNNLCRKLSLCFNLSTMSSPTPCGFQQPVQETVSVLQSVYYVLAYPLWFSTTCAGNCLCASICLLCPRLPPVVFNNLCRKLSLCFNLSTMSSPTPCGFQQPVQETVSVLQSVYYVLAYPLWFSTTCAGNCLCASICLLCPRLPPVVFNNLCRKLSLCFNLSTMSSPTPCGFQQPVQETVSVLQSVYYVLAYPLWFSTTCAGNCLCALIRLLCPRLPPVVFNNLCRKLSLCFNPSTMSSPTPCGFQQPVQETVSVLQSVYYVPAYPLWFSPTCARNSLCASIRLLCPRLPPVVFNNLCRKLSLCFNLSTMSSPTPCGFQQPVQETVSVLQSVYYVLAYPLWFSTTCAGNCLCASICLLCPRLPPVVFNNLCRKLSLCFNLSTMSSPTPCGFQQPVQETVSVLQSVYYVPAYPLWFSPTCARNSLCASIRLLCPHLLQ